jgi:hypothetical protein
MLSGDDNQVQRRLRVDVAEGDYFIVLVDNVGGYLPGYNLTENAVYFNPSFCI